MDMSGGEDDDDMGEASDTEVLWANMLWAVIIIIDGVVWLWS